MKKLLFVLPVLFFFSFSTNDEGLSKKEKKTAITYLEQTRADLESLISGLSEDQFNYKPSDERWSVKECLQHIAMSEDGLWKLCDATLKAAANPDKRGEIKMTDEQLITALTDRSHKVKTSPELTPSSTNSTTALDALYAFRASREKLIRYVKGTKDDMRNHVAQTPVGMLDSYQLVLMIGAHSNRHTQQISEVMADAGFPKK